MTAQTEAPRQAHLGPAAPDRRKLLGRIHLRTRFSLTSLTTLLLLVTAALSCYSTPPRNAHPANQGTGSGLTSWISPTASGPVERRPLPPLPIRGVALGLYSQDPEYDYTPHLQEIRALGADWVSLCFNFYQEKVDSIEVGVPDPRTPQWDRIILTTRQAKEMGFRVLLFPVVLIQEPGEKDWRGTLLPSDPDHWYESYQQLITKVAIIGEEERADALSVGSEFNSLQIDTERWNSLIAAARSRFGGAITYSVNWDSLTAPSFFPSLDYVGMTTYFSLTDKNDPTVAEMVARWRVIQEDLSAWRSAHGLPLIFTEVGFPSQDGANTNPWNYFLSETVDLQEQTDCFEAFTEVWLEDPGLAGLFFYNWFDKGGPTDTGYSPRDKPALDVIRRWFKKAPSNDTPSQTRGN